MKGANRKRVKQSLLIKTYLVRSRVMAKTRASPQPHSDALGSGVHSVGSRVPGKAGQGSAGL